LLVKRFFFLLNAALAMAILNLRCTCEIKSRIVMAKAAFNKKKKNLFTSKLDLNLRKKLVKCYVWSRAVYGAETWTLRGNRSETPGKF